VPSAGVSPRVQIAEGQASVLWAAVGVSWPFPDQSTNHVWMWQISDPLNLALRFGNLGSEAVASADAILLATLQCGVSSRQRLFQ
jgi:hypothetical protein